MSAVAKHRALAMISRNSQGKALAAIKHARRLLPVAFEKRISLHTVARVTPDQLFNASFTIASQLGKHFVGDREDVSVRLTGNAIVKHASFVRARVKPL